VTGPYTKKQKRHPERHGGQMVFAEAGAPRAWHFENPGPWFEQRLVRALLPVSHNVDREMMDLFAGQIAEHVANIYKGRGDRQHMIAAHQPGGWMSG